MYPKVIVRDGQGRRHVFTDVTEDELQTLTEVVWNYASVDDEVTFRGMTLPVLPESDSEVVAVCENGDVLDTHCSPGQFSCTWRIKAQDLKELLGEVVQKAVSVPADNGSSAVSGAVEAPAQPAREGRSRKRRGRSRARRASASPATAVEAPVADEVRVEAEPEVAPETPLALETGGAEVPSAEETEPRTAQEVEAAAEAPEEPRRRRGRSRRRADRTQAASEEPGAVVGEETPADAHVPEPPAVEAEAGAVVPTDTGSAEPEVEAAEEPKKRTTRRRARKATEEAASEQSVEEQTDSASGEVQAKPRRRRSRKAASEAPPEPSATDQSTQPEEG